MSKAETGTEWRTVGLAATMYGAWLGLMVSASYFPTWVTIGLLAITIAWHGSLQHEVVHGHPFASPELNRLLATPPLGLRVPFPVYRRGHLDHHHAVALTDPTEDTESYYLRREKWDDYSPVGQTVLRFHHTLAGRLLLGPLGLVCSFAEHCWTLPGETRSATVRAGRFFSLLFLNNNLHHAHHARPNLAWYELRQAAEALDSDSASAQGAGLYQGYRDVLKKFSIHPQDYPLYPPDRAAAP